MTDDLPAAHGQVSCGTVRTQHGLCWSGSATTFDHTACCCAAVATCCRCGCNGSCIMVSSNMLYLQRAHWNHTQPWHGLTVRCVAQLSR
jgi:hypothetical protein